MVSPVDKVITGQDRISLKNAISQIIDGINNALTNPATSAILDDEDISYFMKVRENLEYTLRTYNFNSD